MELSMHFFQPRVLDMSVDLRRLDAGVAEHFLDQSQVRAAGQQVRRETVPQTVWADLGIDSGAASIAFDQPPQLNAIHGIAAARKEQRLGGIGMTFFGQLVSQLADVSVDRVDRARADRHDTLFSALAFAAELPFIE